jgi:hypothetical protein
MIMCMCSLTCDAVYVLTDVLMDDLSGTMCVCVYVLVIGHADGP